MTDQPAGTAPSGAPAAAPTGAEPGDAAPPGDALDRLSFEELVGALEQTLARMADGAIGIEEAADLYERAGRLHAAAHARLAAVQERIDRLTGGP